jgi:two-component system sensor histidine kinase YesM
VYHPRQQLVYGGLKTELISEILAIQGRYLYAKVDGRDILYTAVPSSQTGWTIVAVSYLDELFSGMREAVYFFLMLAILSFSVAVAVSWYISMRISKPIESLRKSMQQVENGNFDIDITVRTKNEIFQLAQDCNIAVKKVRDLIIQNKTEHELKRKLELRTLQAQINPHFLYNALDSIIWMIELGESAQAIEMTSSLAKFFRLGVNRGGEIISIKTEVEYLESYLTIQKTRYKKKLEYSIMVPPELLDFKILKLLIQPLVENSIYHGIKNKDGPGFLQVTGERSEDTIVFRVSDNGTGMSAERLEALRRSLKDTEVEGDSPGEGIPGSGGVGIRNVQDRIRLYFGPEYGLDFESLPGRGTMAIIRIPVLREETR